MTWLGKAKTLSIEDEWKAWYQVEPEFVGAFCLALTLAYRVRATEVLDESAVLQTKQKPSWTASSVT